jgi:hypothetical protein
MSEVKRSVVVIGSGGFGCLSAARKLAGKIPGLCLFVLMMAALSLTAHAQQTIFNVPVLTFWIEAGCPGWM